MRNHILALAIALCACTPEKTVETAESRANLFVASIINQNAQTFWDSLDQPSQEAIAALAGGKATDQDVVQKAFALSGRWRSLVSLKPIKSKASVDATETTITIESLAGEKMELKMTHTGDRWFIHLPIEQLTAPASKPTTTSAPASAPTSGSMPASTATSAPTSAPK